MRKKIAIIGMLVLLFRAVAYGQDETPPEQPRKTVGVILPLTGKWKSVGQKILKGIELASNVFSVRDTPGVEYLIRDYASEDAAIPQIIDELDREGHVSAIIGPIGGSAGEITCKQCQKRAIPTILFTQTGLSAQEGSYCFSNFLTFYTQTRTLLQTARSLNITRFAILYPTDQFGETFTKSFEQLAPQYGVQILRKTPYSPQKTDFKDVVKPLKDVPIEAVLIPDTATNAAMIASYLPYFKITNVRLFGPNLWDTPELVRQGGRAVQGALFVSGFFAGSENPLVQDFASAFTVVFGTSPTIWEASAYDTAVIMQTILERSSGSRPAVRQGLVALKNYHGVTGITSFSSDGSTRKDVPVLTVQGSRIMELSP